MFCSPVQDNKPPWMTKAQLWWSTEARRRKPHAAVHPHPAIYQARWQWHCSNGISPPASDAAAKVTSSSWERTTARLDQEVLDNRQECDNRRYIGSWCGSSVDDIPYYCTTGLGPVQLGRNADKTDVRSHGHASAILILGLGGSAN